MVGNAFGQRVNAMHSEAITIAISTFKNLKKKLNRYLEKEKRGAPEWLSG